MTQPMRFKSVLNSTSTQRWARAAPAQPSPGSGLGAEGRGGGGARGSSQAQPVALLAHRQPSST
eukprot:8796059-Lingulodinium_polyedra.AAC.1